MLSPTIPEIAFSHFVQSFSSQPLDIFFSIVTLLGHPALWFAIAAFLYWKGEEKKSFFMASNLLFASAVVGIIKNASGRLRPSPQEFRVIGSEADGNLSFPSMHAATISSMLGYYWEAIKRRERIILAVLVGLVMLSRIYLGQHFLGDVIVGALFGLLIGGLVRTLEGKYAKIRFDTKRILEEAGLVLAVGASVVIGLFLGTLSLACVLLGYFAGAFALKLLNTDSSKLNGRTLVAKEALGFAGVAAIAVASGFRPIETIAYFISGLWVSFLFPLVWEKIARKL